MGKLVLIVGMDRSGTSAAAAVAQIVGVDLGDQLIGPRKANPKGYFEDSRCVSVNNELLRNLNHGRRNAAPLPRDWTETMAGRLAGLRAATVLRRLSAPLFGLKDPRLCLTLPLWMEVARRQKHELCVVLCCRNPLEVAASLLSRDGRNPKGSCLMWLTHTIAALQASHDVPRMVLGYDEMMADPVAAAARIKGFAAGSEAIGEAERAAILDFVDPKLYKSRAAAEPGDSIEETAVELFGLLRSGDEAGLAAWFNTGTGALMSRMQLHAAIALRDTGPPPPKQFEESEAELEAAE